MPKSYREASRQIPWRIHCEGRGYAVLITLNVKNCRNGSIAGRTRIIGAALLIAAGSHSNRSPMSSTHESQPWADALHRVLTQADVRQAFYVPDAGHTRLIRLLHADERVQTTVLTTEEEGIAAAAGAWLGGQRSVVLMQSSGVGNCINMLSLAAMCRFPLLTIITMRGEWAEFNPWQIPMGHATAPALELMGVKSIRVDKIDDVDEVASSAATLAFDSYERVAILLSQRLLGRKQWTKK